MQLSVKALALAGGLFWGVCLFVWTLVLALTGWTWGSEMLNLMVGYYPYYEISVTGAFVGLVAGFIDGLVSLGIFGWLYNRFAK